MLKINNLLLLFLLLLTSFPVFAGGEIEAVLKKLQKEYNIYYKVDNPGEISVFLKENDENIELTFKEIKYYEDNNMKAVMMFTPVLTLPDDYTPSKSLLLKINEISDLAVPGKIILYEEKYIMYVSYFWFSSVSRNTILNEMTLLIANYITARKELIKFVDNER